MQFIKVFAILILIVQLTIITPSCALERRVWARSPISEVRKRGIELAVTLIYQLTLINNKLNL
ncbi:hypothetical protein C2G38_2153540 [Gigaspora rosea]|uniref:Uncharacterized protein n=1 Tax=Gigaspora rosea TaxID=44941 RepID=A0A397W9H4_9GLOM|nr:hypothetical protein C2G38_2153540 [Gigaspora rosea]